MKTFFFNFSQLMKRVCPCLSDRLIFHTSDLDADLVFASVTQMGSRIRWFLPIWGQIKHSDGKKSLKTCAQMIRPRWSADLYRRKLQLTVPKLGILGGGCKSRCFFGIFMIEYWYTHKNKTFETLTCFSNGFVNPLNGF